MSNRISIIERAAAGGLAGLKSRASGNDLRGIAEAAFAAQSKPLAAPEVRKAGKGKQAPQANKYRAKKVVTEEGVFDSQMEYKRWCELRTMERARLITNLERQIEYRLEVNGVKIGKFTADHRWEANGKVWVEDVKGVIVRDFTLRKKLMLAIYGIDVMVWPERKKKKRKAVKR